MKKEVRTLVYDDELNIEAYRFEGIVQPFPNHFHDYYVIGLIESGKRRLLCNNAEFKLSSGDMMLLNPSDSHGCERYPKDSGSVLDYRALNISRGRMSKLALEITGSEEPVSFSENVINDEEISGCFLRLHEMIMSGFTEFEKEEALLILISGLIWKFGKPYLECVSQHTAPIERACRFMDENYSERITLDELCEYSGLSKSTLLRSFTKAKGVTPYRYLQAIRIGKAKELMEQGAKPVDAALMTGFSDQSHFTNFFGTFIGLPPGSYSRIFQNNHNKENENE